VCARANTNLQNIAKAQKEIERLEAEEDEGANGTTEAARKPAQKTPAVNGNASTDAVTETAEDLKKASLEDNETVDA
jgi:hypothetical protein